MSWVSQAGERNVKTQEIMDDKIMRLFPPISESPCLLYVIIYI